MALDLDRVKQLWEAVDQRLQDLRAAETEQQRRNTLLVEQNFAVTAARKAHDEARRALFESLDLPMFPPREWEE